MRKKFPAATSRGFKQSDLLLSTLTSDGFNFYYPSSSSTSECFFVSYFFFCSVILLLPIIIHLLMVFIIKTMIIIIVHRFRTNRIINDETRCYSNNHRDFNYLLSIQIFWHVFFPMKINHQR